MLDPSHVIQYIEVLLQEDVTYKKKLVRILGRELKVLRKKEIPLVKVFWQHDKEDEATWELEIEMYEKYPHLFNFQLEVVL